MSDIYMQDMPAGDDMGGAMPAGDDQGGEEKEEKTDEGAGDSDQA